MCLKVCLTKKVTLSPMHTIVQLTLKKKKKLLLYQTMFLLSPSLARLGNSFNIFPYSNKHNILLYESL